MSNITASASAISKLLVENKLPSATSVDVYTYIYSGLTSGMDYFGTSGPGEIVHPTYDLMGENAYLAMVRDMPKLTESIDTSFTPHRMTVVRQGTSGSADVKSLELYDPEIVGVPDFAMISTMTENAHWNVDGGAEYHHSFLPTFDFVSQSTGINVSLNFGAALSGPGAFVSLFEAATPGLASDGRRFALYYNMPTLNLPAGVYAVPEVVIRSDSLLANAVAASGFLDYPIVRRLGLRVEHRGLGTSDTPYVAGTRRFLIITGNGVAGQFLFLSGYILGEGPDLVYYHVALEDEGDDWDVWYTPVIQGFVSVPLPQPFAAGDMRRSSVIDVSRYFAFSWSVDFVDTIIGVLSADSATEEVLLGDVLVRYHIRSIAVSKVVGRVMKDAYRDYLSTGYGVYAPKKAEEVELIMKKWANVAESVSYTYAPVVLDQPYTLKKTKAYEEYGKRREKACKTNNFLDLPYNEEYSMKTVENKLTTLKNLSVLAVDSREVGTIKTKTPSAVPPVSTVATVTAVGKSQFSYSTNTGLSGTKALTEVGVSEFLDVVMPATFAGDISMLEQVVGSGLTEFSQDAAGYDVTEVRLDLQGMFIPNYPDWTVMRNTLSYDERAAFLCAQLTDYRQFDSSLPKLIRQFTGDRMYPAILKEFSAQQTQ